MTALRERVEALDRGGVALRDIHHREVTVGQLLVHGDALVEALRAAGVEDGEPVAIAVPGGGIDLAVATSSLLASGHTCVPADPRMTATEYLFLLDDVRPVAIIVSSQTPPDVVRSAAERGLALIELDLSGASSRAWNVVAGRRCSPAPAWEVSLCLHTSGTTARSKLVGLRDEQLVSSAMNVARTLDLRPDDRGFLVMPLFHIHGIVAGLLAPLLAGSSVIAAGAFDPFQFERRVAVHGATWVSAVPSAYRAVLRASRSAPRTSRLRILRSSSSPLDLRLSRDVEQRYGCSLLNSYGMTEAAHQMASQALGRASTERMDVGLPNGSELGVLVAGDVRRSPGVTGEVVVRGPQVIDRYLAPEAANAEAFVDGWLRTGDLGCFSEDGTLELLGRVKEIINVAGEKVSPFEVESALRDFPGLTDVAAFGAPDTVRGERVHVVATVEHGCDVAGLRSFARERLAVHKMPATVTVVEAIPLGPTGKVQRGRLAQQLGIVVPVEGENRV